MIAGLLLTLLNVGLVAVPIGGAVTTLTVVDYYRAQNGQSPLFTEEGGDGAGQGGGGGPYTGDPGASDPDTFNYTANYTWPGSLPNASTVVGGVRLSKYCQQYVDINVGTTTGQNYTLNPNQWGWKYGDEGGLCLNVTTHTNQTYATNITAPQWSVNWQYDKAPDTAPVHAFPNIMMDDAVLPIKLGAVKTMSLSVQWAYEDYGTALVGTITTTTTYPARPKSTSSAKATGTGTAKATGTATGTATGAATGTATGTTRAAAPTTTAAAATTERTTAPAPAATTSAAAAAPADEDTTSAAAPAVPATTPAAAAAPAAESSAAVAARNRFADIVDEVDEEAIAARAVKQNMALYERYVETDTFAANVAVDMFFDADKKKAGNTSAASYEVMVWFAQFGQYTDPIGFSNGSVTSYVVDAANFTLYAGRNGNKQHVLTWVAEKAAADFSGSLLQLVNVLPQLDLDFYPGVDDYLGYFAFGTECYYSSDNVTFFVQDLSMEVV